MKERGITISKFLESKELKMKEVEETFQLVKRLDIDMISHSIEKDGCVNCGNKSNSYSIKCESWTGATFCVACDSLMFIIFSDRMGGGHNDAVFVYEQKNRPMYRLYFKCDIQKDCIECRHCGTISSDKEDIENKFCKKCNKTLE